MNRPASTGCKERTTLGSCPQQTYTGADRCYFHDKLARKAPLLTRVEPRRRGRPTT